MSETKQVDSTSFRRRLGDLVDETNICGTRYIYTRWGRARAALVSLADLAILEALGKEEASHD